MKFMVHGQPFSGLVTALVTPFTEKNEIDDKNIRVMFKQAKDPVELAFAHIDSQPLQKIATNAIKESVLDIQEGFEDLKDSMSDIKDSFGDFFSFLGKFFTSNEEFIPEQI